MAKIELSGIGITAMGGRIGDDVIARNIYGYYRRANVTSDQPDSIWQNNWQSKLKQTTQRWPLLTDAQRRMWQAAADSGEWHVGGLIGTKSKPSGQILFIKVNMGAWDYSFPILEPPKKRSFLDTQIPRITSIVADAPNSLVVGLSTNTIPTETACYLFSTGSISPGIMRPQWSKFKLLYQAPYTAYGNSLEIGPQYVQRYGNMVAGKKLYVHTMLVDWRTGIHIDGSRMSTTTI